MASSKWGPDSSTNDPTKMAQTSMSQMSEMWDMLGQTAKDANKRLKEERDYQDMIELDLQLKEAQVQETLANEAYKRASAIKAVKGENDKSYAQTIQAMNAIGRMIDDEDAIVNNKEASWQERARAQKTRDRLAQERNTLYRDSQTIRNQTTPRPTEGAYTGAPTDEPLPDQPSTEAPSGAVFNDGYPQPVRDKWNNEGGALTLKDGLQSEEEATRTEKEWNDALASNNPQLIDKAIGDIYETYAETSKEGQSWMQNLKNRKEAIAAEQAGKVKQSPADEVAAIVRDIEMSDLTEDAKKELKQYRYDRDKLESAYKAKLDKLAEYSPGKLQAKLKVIEGEAKAAGAKKASELVASKDSRVEFTPDGKTPIFSPAQLYQIKQAEEEVRLTRDGVTATFNEERKAAGGKELPPVELPPLDPASLLNPSIKPATPYNLRQ